MLMGRGMPITTNGALLRLAPRTTAPLRGLHVAHAFAVRRSTCGVASTLSKRFAARKQAWSPLIRFRSLGGLLFAGRAAKQRSRIPRRGSVARSEAQGARYARQGLCRPWTRTFWRRIDIYMTAKIMNDWWNHNIPDLGPRTSDFVRIIPDLGPRTSDLGPRTNYSRPRTSDLGRLSLC